ncbi:MarR family transcriptional regulator [Leifsonia soli]|uniref:DNA-binding MarR family transcriptional regulator n=1 Tax=Leifsonia soli TaxID=582665 RepID=A0A852T630_9MICO|nr:DNA-binding MarR family transcriptional regulator [Leifsonia soli]
MATKTASDGLVRLFDDLVRCETRLYNAIGDALRAEHGIATSQYEFLRYFRDHPGSRIADVAATFAAGIGAISKGVDRLEARGWVARHPNPADGRSSLVSLTASGAVLVADAENTFRERLAELTSPALAASDVEAIGPVLAAVRATLERDRVGLPVG